MIPRLVLLVALAIVTQPLVSLFATFVSAPDSVLVFFGLAGLLGTAVAWTYIARYYIHYFQRKDVQDALQEYFGFHLR